MRASAADRERHDRRRRRAVVSPCCAESGPRAPIVPSRSGRARWPSRSSKPVRRR